VRGGRFLELGGRDRLLLRAAVLPGEHARSAWLEWIAGVELEKLPFDEARMLPRVYANLATHGWSECLPPRLRGKYRWVWTSNHMRGHAVTPALAALADAGIPTMLLKGAALLASERCAWGAREMGDVDILVPVDSAVAAARALEAAGWSGQSGVTPEFLARRLLTRRHGWNYEGETPHANLDLHWHAFEGVRVSQLDNELFRRARRVHFAGTELFALDDCDQALHLIEHASHGEPAHRLGWIADTATVLEHVEPARFARRARELETYELAREALETVAAVLDAPWSQAIRAGLARHRPSVHERVLGYTETGTIAGRTFPRLSELVRSALVHGRGARDPLRRLRRVAQRRIEPGLCAHPLLSAVLALFGRPRRVEVLALRVSGPLGRPPALRAVHPGQWLELTTAGVVDRVAGPGWSWPTADGVWTDGADARLALDVAAPRGRPLALEFRFGRDASRSPNPCALVLVNGRPLTEWRFGAGSRYTPQRLSIPAWLADWCRPIDVAIRPVLPFTPESRDRGPGDARPSVQLYALRLVED
jgi:hypothetical protein